MNIKSIVLLLGCSSVFFNTYAYQVVNILPAKVFTVANHICITAPQKEGVKIKYLSIRELGASKKLSKEFDAKENEQTIISAKKCINTFNYPFEAGHSYNIEIGFRGNTKDKNGSFIASFSTWKNGNNLEVTQIE